MIVFSCMGIGYDKPKAKRLIKVLFKVKYIGKNKDLKFLDFAEIDDVFFDINMDTKHILKTALNRLNVSTLG